MKILHKLIEYDVPVKDLVLIYVLYVRSICEQSAVVWHSSLTEENRNDIERVQKTALKIILKSEYINYSSALERTNLKTLNERRELLCLKFAKSCIKNKSTEYIFPLNKNRTNLQTRFTEKFYVQHANTERLKRSPVIYMQNLLNQDDLRS